MTRPLFAEIDLNALKFNLSLVRNHAPQSKIFAIVKANAYGHGVIRVAKGLSAADGFALLELQDAVNLRQAGFNQRILLLEGFFDSEELATVAEYGISVVIHSPEQLKILRNSSLPVKLDVFLKINTGMNRLGFVAEQLREVIAEMRNNPLIDGITLMSHFSTADEKAGIAAQLHNFNEVTEDLMLPVSLANSAAVLRYPESHRDWVRPGIMLYGASPFADQSAKALGLKPVMSLISQIISVQKLKMGDYVGYGQNFRADRLMRVGVVACGYADGYSRHAPSGTPILICGKLTKTVGRVSMDLLCADITDIPEAQVGSSVELWGGELSVDDVAMASGTVGYELLCAVAPRVPIVEKN